MAFIQRRSPRFSFVRVEQPVTVYNQSVDGTLSFVGGQVRQIGKQVSASLSLSGSVVKTATRYVVGVFSFVGTFVRLPAVAVSGSVGFAGGVVRRTSLLLLGSLSFGGLIGTTKIAVSALYGYAETIVVKVVNAITVIKVNIETTIRGDDD